MEQQKFICIICLFALSLDYVYVFLKGVMILNCLTSHYIFVVNLMILNVLWFCRKCFFFCCLFDYISTLPKKEGKNPIK